MMDDNAKDRYDAALAAHIARHYVAHRDLAAARAALTPALAAPPSATQEREAVVEVGCDVALGYARQGNIGLAAELIDSLRALAESPPTWRAAATIASRQGDVVAAEELWRRVAAAEPSVSASWLGLAHAHEAAQNVPEAVTAYLQAARVDPNHAVILSVADKLGALEQALPEAPPAQQVRIAILGSSTLDDVQSYLEVHCRLAGLTPTFYLGPFDQYAQDILAPASQLYSFAPDVIILAIHGRALFPALYDHPFDRDVAARREAVAKTVDQLSALLKQLTARTSALVLLHTFATPQYSPLGILDRRDPFGQSALFTAINDSLAERVRQEFPTIHLIDEDRVYGRVGKRHVTDPRMWYLARIGIAEEALGALSQEYLRFIKALKGRTRKCIVLDLDNTLWGGVVGEDGPEGIALGQDAPGNTYRAFQEVLLSLWQRGIILAINSKNNEAEALAVLEHHPEMILRPQHFAALRINWLDKVSNMEALAAELNIGLDSMVFIDDNPAECALMRGRLPQVLTVELPRDPERYRGLLLEMSDFDTLSLTTEDRQRGQLYTQRRERQQWESQHADDLGAYLAELDLVVEVAPADAFALPRIAQLIGKTNQFNLTTRRHTEATVRAYASTPAYAVYSARVTDRFGDHGIVGAAIVATEGNVWVIDTLLLSCRVLGRGVETAVLSALVAAARAGDAQLLRGIFVPTAKNEPARDFYLRHGFTLVRDDAELQEWDLDLRSADVASPAWLTLRSETAAALTGRLG